MVYCRFYESADACDTDLFHSQMTRSAGITTPTRGTGSNSGKQDTTYTFTPECVAAAPEQTIRDLYGGTTK